MKTVGAYEAKTHLPRLLKEVAEGKVITITNRGVPIAKLIPAEEHNRAANLAEAFETIRRIRERSQPLQNISIDDLIQEGRRF